MFVERFISRITISYHTARGYTSVTPALRGPSTQPGIIYNHGPLRRRSRSRQEDSTARHSHLDDGSPDSYQTWFHGTFTTEAPEWPRQRPGVAESCLCGGENVKHSAQSMRKHSLRCDEWSGPAVPSDRQGRWRNETGERALQEESRTRCKASWSSHFDDQS